jgi:hypothetical protein
MLAPRARAVMSNRYSSAAERPTQGDLPGMPGRRRASSSMTHQSTKGIQVAPKTLLEALALCGPMAALGLLGVLSIRYGAETRPVLDERPHDERPNW